MHTSLIQSFGWERRRYRAVGMQEGQVVGKPQKRGGGHWRQPSKVDAGMEEEVERLRQKASGPTQQQLERAAEAAGKLITVHNMATMFRRTVN